MKARILVTLAVGVLVVGLLGGCVTTAARQDMVGLPTAENPEYLAHPFRLLALPANLAGNILQYGLVEPFYFLLGTAPDAVGLSREERRYIDQREEAWRQYFAGERPLVQ